MDWTEVFNDKQTKEINEFLLNKMRECNKDVCEMEYSLHKIVEIAVYDYKVEQVL